MPNRFNICRIATQKMLIPTLLYRPELKPKCIFPALYKPTPKNKSTQEAHLFLYPRVNFIADHPG